MIFIDIDSVVVDVVVDVDVFWGGGGGGEGAGAGAGASRAFIRRSSATSGATSAFDRPAAFKSRTLVA